MDIITLLASIGAIGAVSAFLRQAVIDYKIKGARSFKTEPFGKRFLTEHTLVDAILIGMFHIVRQARIAGNLKLQVFSQFRFN